MLLILALLFIGCRGDGIKPGTPVILISIDTLRSDRLPAYGYTGVATPNLDAFRADSILYERAYSHCPLTAPSHVAMFTGLLPSEHGIRDNIGYRLSDKIPTLPEVLKASGYSTGAAISAFVLRRELGLDRGFDFYDDEVEPLGRSAAAIGRVQRDGRETVRAAERWLDGVDRKPFFLFVHLYEPHTPHRAPEPFFSRYEDRYDGEVAYVDQLVGELMASLKRRDVYDKSLVILVSDHGEGLNDHGELEHGIFLYRETLQVPLMIKLPRSRRGGATVLTPVQLIDLFPTILQRIVPTIPSHNTGARSLLTVRDDADVPRPIYSETYYPRFHFGWSDLHSLIDGQHHYIRAPIPELYDLSADPGEKTNTLEANRRAYFAMRQSIEPFVKKAEQPAPIDPEEAAKLAALGYVGSNVSTVEGEDLPDPKTTIDVFRQIRLAYTYFRDQKLDEALRITNELLRDNDRIVDLWDLKSKILSQLGRTKEAVEAARAGLKHQPHSVGLIMAVANLSILTGELEQAEQHADLLLKTETARAHEIRARIWLEREDYERARQEATLLQQAAHDDTAPLMVLGLIEKQRGDLEGALRYFDQAVQSASRSKSRRVANLHFYRGDVLARLGRNDEAEAAFRKEIEEYPIQPDAYASLILLLSSERRVEEATKVVFDLIRASPTPPAYIAIAETLKVVGDDRGAIYWAHQGVAKYPEDDQLRRLLQQVRRPLPVRGS